MLRPLPNHQWTRRTADHLLLRAGFGGSPSEREAFYQLGRAEGVAGAVDHMLTGGAELTSFAYPDWSNYNTSGELLSEDLRPGEGPFSTLTETEYNFAVKYSEFTEWFMRHMLEGPGVAGKMFKFFVDHFPIDYRRLYGNRIWMYSLRHFHLLRRFSLGNFGELVHGVGVSPAMMQMLDVHVNTRSRINENFGRELLELFTMGVGGGYSEADVVAASRAFTGQVLSGGAPHLTWYYGPFIDGTEKEFMGEILEEFDPGTESAEENHGPAVTDIALAHPSTSRYLVWKLWRYFVHESPDPGLVEELGDRFRGDYNYELTPLLREILSSEAFYEARVMLRQVKDPADYIIGATRQLEVPLLPDHTLRFAMEELGLALVEPPSIAGWPEPIGAGNQWLSAGSTISRMNLPNIWINGDHKVLARYREIPVAGDVFEELPLPSLDLEVVAPHHLRGRKNLNLLIDSLVDRFLPLLELSSEQRRILYDFADRTDQFSDAPEEQNIATLVRHIMALPEYQLQ